MGAAKAVKAKKLAAKKAAKAKRLAAKKTAKAAKKAKAKATAAAKKVKAKASKAAKAKKLIELMPDSMSIPVVCAFSCALAFALLQFRRGVADSSKESLLS